MKKERRYITLIYFALIAVFISISILFFYTESTQRKSIYKFIYNWELKETKKDIKLETYAAITYIDQEAKFIFSKIYERLNRDLKDAIIQLPKNSSQYLSYIKQFNSSHNTQLAIITGNKVTPSFIKLNSCHSYKYFSMKNTYMCKTTLTDTNHIPQYVLLLKATTKIDNLTPATFINLTKLELNLLKSISKKINNLIFKYKTQDSYIFIVKILNINGGKNFGYDLYNLSKGIKIGKLISSSGVDYKGNHYREEYLKALKKYGETYSKYWYPSPTNKSPQEKISFRKLYRPLNWMVGTGFYVAKLQKQAMQITNRLFSRLKYFHILFFFIYFILLLIIHLLNRRFTNALSKDTSYIIRSIPNVGNTVMPVDTTKLNFERFKLIGKTLNDLSADLIRKKEQIETNRIEFIKAFVKVLEVRDVYTKGHSERVALYAKKIGELLGLDEKKRYKLYLAGLLHDLGKVAIPDSILLKPGKLSDYEYEVMKLHPIFSYELIKNISFFKDVAIHVRQHHERCNGNGYPDGLLCDEITLEGKILAIADVFDALTTLRPYRKAFDVEKALDIMKDSQLDEKILSKIENNLHEILIKEKDQQEISRILDIVEKSRIDLFEKDILTGLYRIKSLIKYIDRKLSKKETFYLFMIDIKHLKKINYLLGHEKGNELLLKISKIIKNLENTEHHSRIGANFFSFIYTENNPLKLENQLKEKLSKIEINNFKPEFYTAFISSTGIKNGEEMIYLLEMQIQSLKITSLKKE